MTPEDKIKKDIEKLIPPPDLHFKFQMINNEVNEFERLAKWLADRLVIEKDEDKDPLPFYINTKKHREQRQDIRAKAEKHVNNKRRWTQRASK